MKAEDGFLTPGLRPCQALPGDQTWCHRRSLFPGPMSSPCRRQPSAKSAQHGAESVMLAFDASDNKLKPFSYKCDDTLDSFPWQSTKWPPSNRGKETEPGS